ncbi:uncharacterized protein N7511_004690 [Penicillium nucicola]|uniref:uncharacterized protein n=1 Tax=Penicillium nucicola TaxID=1850975 RepID=UPI002544EDDF|nr:uncharacterized protein N7511_004690 [Penicillium nucicola]KAJ5767074.1 hypothetical protein N7511_004690 [Penicillium nucicola]
MEPTSPPPHPTTVPENPRKGILRRPKPSFPEDLNFIQEGVAPIKDATKPGIPPGARWTKIDRRLVNPEALEAGRERFEERSDYVIVLRVLSKEEIQNYAVKTQEIRDGRQRQVQEKGKERHKLNKKQVQDTSDAGAQSDTVETKNSGSLLTLIT